MHTRSFVGGFLTLFLLSFSPFSVHAREDASAEMGKNDALNILGHSQTRNEGCQLLEAEGIFRSHKHSHSRKHSHPSKSQNVLPIAIVPCDVIQVPSPYAVVLKNNCRSNSQIHFIKESDFRGKGRNGIIINQPGVYRLQENITFKPTRSNVQAITITASNVVLDLGPFTLRQNLSRPQTGVYGIAIARDVQNVAITSSDDNGRILDFTLAGIRVMGRTDQITIENVTITQTTPVILTNDIVPDCPNIGCILLTGGFYVGEGERSGLAFNGTDKNNLVTNLVVNNVIAEKCIAGSQIVMTFGLEINNSSFVENTSTGLLLGCNFPIPGDVPNTFVFPCASDGIIRNCHFDRTVGDNQNITGGGGFFKSLQGLSLVAIQKIVLENCTCNDNHGTGETIGATPDTVNDITFRNCTFTRNISDNADAFGIAFTGLTAFQGGPCVGLVDQPIVQCTNITMDNCIAEDNQGGDQTVNNVSGVGGILFDGVSGATVTDCLARGNFCSHSLNQTTSGFAVEAETASANNTNITFLRCVAENNGNEGINPATGGFQLRSCNNNVVLRDCVAIGNGQQPDTAIYAGGFVINSSAFPPPFTPDFFTENIIFDHCIASGNGAVGQPALINGGIIIRALSVRPPVNNVLIQNCTLNYNQNGLFVNNDMTGLVVKNNEADQNAIAGFDLTALTSTAFVTANIAYDNPAGNYLGAVIPLADIINASASLGNLPTAVGAKNLSVVP